MAVVSFSIQVVWIYLSQRRGAGEGGQRHQHNIKAVDTNLLMTPKI